MFTFGLRAGRLFGFGPGCVERCSAGSAVLLPRPATIGSGLDHDLRVEDESVRVWHRPGFGLEVAVGEETFELSLDPVLGAASEARRATRTWLADSAMPDALLDDLELVISELVTNAVIHAGTRLRLVVQFDGHRVVTEVFDADARLPTLAASADDVGGRGLILVDRLSDRWGSEALTEGKRVWAELSVDD